VPAGFLCTHTDIPSRVKNLSDGPAVAAKGATGSGVQRQGR
jgi:hypothetical protein